MRFITFAALLCTLGFGCGQKNAAEAGKQNEGWEIISESNYYIEYPPEWELETNKNLGTSFIIFARDPSQGKFRENVNLVIQDLKGQNFNLNRYVVLSEQQIQTMMGNSKLIESKRINIGNDEYHQIIYLGDHENFHLKWKQLYWIKDNKAYVLTFTGTQETYDEYISTADKIFNSFKITAED